MRAEVRWKVPTVVLLAALALSASPSRAEDLKKLASDLSTRIHAAKRERVTVVDFVDLDKKPTKLGKYLAQKLQTALAEPETQLDVVDQSHLGQLLEQMEKLSEGLIDKETGQQLGKMAGTEVLIVGTVMPSSLSVRLDVKAIDLQTAKMIMGGSASMARISIIDRLASDSDGESEEAEVDEENSKGKSHSGKATASKASKHTPPRSRRDQGVDFELEGCSLSGDTLTCGVTVTSETRDRWLALGFESRVWNESGDEFDPDNISIANLNSERDCARKQILKDVPTRTTVTFPQFGADASTVERLRVYWAEQDNCWSNWRPVEFEKIAISEDEDFTSPRAKTSSSGRSRASSLTGGGGGATAKGKAAAGGFLQRMKGQMMGVLEGAATNFIDQKTHGLLGKYAPPDEDEEEKVEPKKKIKTKKVREEEDESESVEDDSSDDDPRSADTPKRSENSKNKDGSKRKKPVKKQQL